MANGINNLLALGSLQFPGMKKKNNQPNYSERPMDMMSPINNNVQGNMGVFGQPLLPQPSMNVQSPSQLSASLQIDALGGGPDQTGEDPVGTGVGTYGEIDPNDNTGVAPPTGSTMTTSGSSPMGNVMAPFSTPTSSLLESFYGGLQDPYKSQILAATSADSESGAGLSLKELADLAGFDTSKLTQADYDALQKAGIGRFANYMQGTEEKLQNLQQYRSMLLGQAAQEGSYAVEGLLGMTEDASVSGLQSGRKAGRSRRARKSLREAMRTQLLGGEEQYQSELDSLRSEVVGGLQAGLTDIADKVIGLNADFGTKLKDYSYEFSPTDSAATGPGQPTTQGGNPAQYQQIYNSYNIEQQDMQTVQNYINSYFMQNNYYPTSGELDNYIQSLGYGQDEEMV